MQRVLASRAPPAQLCHASQAVRTTVRPLMAAPCPQHATTQAQLSQLLMGCAASLCVLLTPQQVLAAEAPSVLADISLGMEPTAVSMSWFTSQSPADDSQPSATTSSRTPSAFDRALQQLLSSADQLSGATAAFTDLLSPAEAEDAGAEEEAAAKQQGLPGSPHMPGMAALVSQQALLMAGDVLRLASVLDATSATDPETRALIADIEAAAHRVSRVAGDLAARQGWDPSRPAPLLTAGAGVALGQPSPSL